MTAENVKPPCTETPERALPLLECVGIAKRFGPVLANSGVDLAVHAGQVVAVLGENGAGKSTLMSVIAGRYRPDEGELRMDGLPVRFTSPAQALQRGIGMVYQRFMLIGPLTVAENILLAADAAHIKDKKRHTLASVTTRISELAERYGLHVDPKARIRDLSMGERQRVEILKLLVQDARILIFDEPTAVLAQPEVEGLFEVFRKLKADGRGILFITHKLEEVLTAADRIAILRRGRIVAQTEPCKINNKLELARLMVGRELVLRVDKPEMPIGEAVFEAKGLSGTAFEDICFAVRKGEVLSIVGVAGNGQEALAEALAGTAPATGGFVSFMGHEYSAREWHASRDRQNAGGIAYVPEDRHHVGSIAGMGLRENFFLTRREAAGDGAWLDADRMENETLEAISRFNIVTHDTATLAGSLSGGNLQKLLLAREMARNPGLFIAEQPTQGLDIKATEDVWAAILAQREHSGVLIVTGDLKEALSLSDRIGVMFRGRLLEIIDTRDAERVERIGLLMAGTVQG
ncbi:ABC transporter ATP-binding protein [Desulfovibrio mangrovi]|uniref:ABC transporter ATP-binding protein n=1 Tax=Desulfovibrio mangrovi TaxID=2976983 RepID=UPI0022479D0D|nr:ABC transporter ATP-binding protein [Desulfovibrio mangrovi]UZP66907.1 ABC transporter ATP-binding protein [Desulfovibrio mangrovi]